MLAPLITDIDLSDFLKENFIEYVICGGENYGTNVRICDYKWVKHISDDCRKYNTTFVFIETGSKWIDNDGILTEMPSKIVEAKEAGFTNLNYFGRQYEWNLSEIDDTNYLSNWFAPWCNDCNSKFICDGCKKCGKCKRDL